MIKLLTISDKEKILKTAREKRRITLSRTNIRVTADFSSEIMQVRKK